MIVYCPFHLENRIEDPAFISARWTGDDTPLIVAVPRGDLDRWLTAWTQQGASAHEIAAESAKSHSDARGFVGILQSKSNGLAAWGNCRFA